MYKLKINKKGLSPIIATVLLILIAIVLVGIVAIFLIPNLTTNAKERSACFDAINHINFDESGYNCYYTDDDGKDGTAFAVNIRSTDITGFRVGLIAKGVSDTIDVKNGETSSVLRMYDGLFGGILEVVNEGGVRTYVANGVYDRVDLFPIITLNDGFVCQTTRKSLDLGQCLDANIKKNIGDGDPICGNNAIEAGETCDDGNKLDGDGCSSVCIKEGDQPKCGNNVLDAGEECDLVDGNYDYGGETCLTKGFDKGSLQCASCKVDITGCSDNPAECTLTTASWDKASVYEGETVKLTVGGQDCDDKTLSFVIKEDDTLVLEKFDEVITNNLQATFGPGKTQAETNWAAEWRNDDGVFESNPPEYYFRGLLGAVKSSASGNLKVLACGDNKINGLEACDGTDLNGKVTCHDYNPIYNEGNVACYARGTPNQCSFDTSACKSVDKCDGNGDVCSPPGKVNSCTMGNGYPGTQKCNDFCNGWSDCSTNLFCGDNICTNPPENKDTCIQDCNICGDGKTYGSEQCDDGNHVDDDSCTNGCKLTYCGDNKVNNGEQCDDGNNNNGDGCSSICTTEGGQQVCPNGKLEYPETCDDGNNNAGDGCYQCQVEGDENGSPWHCSGGLGEKSICCNDVTGQCTGGNNYGGKNYDPGQETKDGCLGPETPGSCAYTFGNQFGWKNEPGVKCSLGLNICSRWKDECPSVGVKCDGKNNGYIYGYTMGVCCYEKGICEISWDPCTCIGA